jgi:UDP-2-acetamido-2,6-beta-L-arabino-hexul-4-ose reductase
MHSGRTERADPTSVNRVLITDGCAFLGRNLAVHLRERDGCVTFVVDQETSQAELQQWLTAADVVFHVGGVYRSTNPTEFERGNAVFTKQLCDILQDAGRAPKIVFESSIQADFQNPYGASKLKAEDTLRAFAVTTGASVRIFRLKGLFGKWCPPNYNSVTATFCYNIANELPVVISDPANEVELNYVDDVVAAFLWQIDNDTPQFPHIATTRLRLDDLVGRIQAFHEMGATLKLPDFADSFCRALYATYLSYVPREARERNLSIRIDARGTLAEFIKSEHFGQIFVSRTVPGGTRGNHYHHTKTEQFLVVEGNGLIRMRPIEGGPVEEYPVQGSKYQVIDIPPGFTHSITNVGLGEMVTLFWSSEVFNPDRPDTCYLPVDEGCQQAAEQRASWESRDRNPSINMETR